MRAWYAAYVDPIVPSTSRPRFVTTSASATANTASPSVWTGLKVGCTSSATRSSRVTMKSYAGGTGASAGRDVGMRLGYAPEE